MKQLSLLFIIGSVVLGYTNMHLSQLENEDVRARVFLGDRAEETKQRLDTLIEKLYNQGRVELIPELVSEDFASSSLSDGEYEYEGTTPLREGILKAHVYHPNLHIRVDEWIAYNDRIVFFWKGGNLLDGGVPLIDEKAPMGHYGIAIFCFNADGKLQRNYFMRCSTSLDDTKLSLANFSL